MLGNGYEFRKNERKKKKKKVGPVDVGVGFLVYLGCEIVSFCYRSQTRLSMQTMVMDEGGGDDMRLLMGGCDGSRRKRDGHECEYGRNNKNRKKRARKWRRVEWME